MLVIDLLFCLVDFVVRVLVVFNDSAACRFEEVEASCLRVFTVFEGDWPVFSWRFDMSIFVSKPF